MDSSENKLNRILDALGDEYSDVLWRLNDSKIIHLSVDDVLCINKYVHQIGHGKFGVRDKNLLESAVMAIQQKETYAGEASPLSLGMTLMEHLIRNHPFIDGNKRTGTMAFLTFCRLNGVQKHFDHDWLVRTAELLAVNKNYSPDPKKGFIRTNKENFMEH